MSDSSSNMTEEQFREEIYNVIQRTLVLIENADNLLKSDPPVHIPAYHKILGVQQKLERLPKEMRECFFTQIIATRGTISYFLNGRYDEGRKQLLNIKKDLIKLGLKLHENNQNSVVSEKG